MRLILKVNVLDLVGLPRRIRPSANVATPPHNAKVTTLANKPLICRRFYQNLRNYVKYERSKP